jgi:hypothetical protein
MVCVVSSSVLSAGSLVDHLSGTEGKYLSIASRKRALSVEDRSIRKNTGVHRADLHCFGVTMVGSPRAAPPRSLTHDSSFLSLHTGCQHIFLYEMARCLPCEGSNVIHHAYYQFLALAIHADDK